MILTTKWQAHPSAPTDIQIFAIGDCHGHSDELRQILGHLEATPGDGSERCIVFTGDLIDRGPDSLGCIALAMEAKNRFDKRILLPGNHEIMLVQALRDPDLCAVWYHNGGEEFLDEVDPTGSLPVAQALELIDDALPDGFRRLIESGPTYFRHHALTFVHAGLNPHIPGPHFLAEDRFSAVPFERHWAWIREPFLNWTRGWEGDPHHIVVHGHSPATSDYIRTEIEASRFLDRVASHGRLNIDAGAAEIPQVAAVELHRGAYRLHVVNNLNPIKHI